MKKVLKILRNTVERRGIRQDHRVNSIESVSNDPNGKILDLCNKDYESIVKAIAKYTRISNDHITPNVKLHLLTHDCLLNYGAYEKVTKSFSEIEKRTFTEPFWSIYWPGGQGLAKFVFEEHERIFMHSKRDKNVLDLGAGCGAVAIAAKLVGVRNVAANDINEVACIATTMNAALNNVNVHVLCKNLLNKPLQKPYDVIFLGDLLYDEELTEILIPWLLDEAKKGTKIFLGDPGRQGLTNDLKKYLKFLRRYKLPEKTQKEHNGFQEVCVWQFLVAE